MSQLKDYGQWEIVIGLEIHVQLNTRTKLFSHAPNHFGDEPNTNITDVCTGMPGTLPRLNREALKKALRFGVAVGGSIHLVSAFDRKSYFYPDSPRNFQITQFYKPFMEGGKIEVDVEGEPKVFFLNRAHLEDDAGMLKHFSNFAGIDYNRAGAALIEIVSEPCMHSAKDAVSYAMAIKSIVEYLDVSDCNMEEGSLRFDTNISIRKKGEKTLRSKIEIKNLNSFHNMELAISSEVARQIEAYESYPEHALPPTLRPGTYRFDVELGKTVLMRPKESAEDYRYFPEPDLPPVIVHPKELEEIKAHLPELPYQRLHRYLTAFALHKTSAETLVSSKKLSDYYEQALTTHHSPHNVCNWITVEFAGRLKERGLELWDLGILPSHIGELVALIEKGTITGKIAKAVADEMIEKPGIPPAHIVKSNPDYQPISDNSTLEPMVEQVLSSNAESIADYRRGKDKAFEFLVGQVMKLCRGKADPVTVKEILRQKLMKDL